jgi:hypothetical protein
MNKDFDTEIIGISERIKGGYSYLISNFSKIVAVVTAAIATMLVFTDITFLGINSRELTTSLALILVSSYLMYFSLEEAGEKLYEESEDFKNLMAEYFIELEKIGLEKLGSLREYCEKYADEELTYRRRQALLAAGLSAEEYDTFVKNESISKNAFLVAKDFRIQCDKEVVQSRNLAQTYNQVFLVAKDVQNFQPQEQQLLYLILL